MELLGAEVDALLAAASTGDAEAERKLFELSYRYLKRLAAVQLRKMNGMSINPTTLLHEAYIKLATSPRRPREMVHFYNLISRTMRHVLLDIARRKSADKRAVKLMSLSLAEGLPGDGVNVEQIIEVETALAKLEELDPALSQVFQWHYFAGVEFEQIAETLGKSSRTIRRHYEMAQMLMAAHRG